MTFVPASHRYPNGKAPCTCRGSDCSALMLPRMVSTWLFALGWRFVLRDEGIPCKISSLFLWDQCGLALVFILISQASSSASLDWWDFCLESYQRTAVWSPCRGFPSLWIWLCISVSQHFISEGWARSVSNQIVLGWKRNFYRIFVRENPETPEKNCVCYFSWNL